MNRIIGLLLMLFAIPSYGQGSQELEVKGFGRLSAQPDLGVLSIELTTIQLEFSSTVSQLNADFEKVIQHLEKIGFSKEDLKTSNYGVRENTVYRRGTSYDSGFVGNQSIVVEFDNQKEKLAKIIDSFTNSPVEAKFNFSFTISPEKRENLRNEIIKIAISDAKQKARLIAETSGRQLGKIKEIKYGTFPTESLFSSFEGVSMDMMATEQPSSHSLGFDVREIAFKDYVIIVYELK